MNTMFDKSIYVSVSVPVGDGRVLVESGCVAVHRILLPLVDSEND